MSEATLLYIQAWFSFWMIITTMVVLGFKFQGKVMQWTNYIVLAVVSLFYLGLFWVVGEVIHYFV